MVTSNNTAASLCADIGMWDQEGSLATNQLPPIIYARLGSERSKNPDYFGYTFHK